MFKYLVIVLLLLTGEAAVAQNKISFDLAGIRNMRQSLNGSNVSCFYHFNERLAGGAEINRFYPVTKTEGEEQSKKSAWDVDFNLHYLAHLNKKAVFYPLAGFSHTSEKERIITVTPTSTSIMNISSKFWSLNAGAGFLWECGKWAPHIEYSFSWGHINQQFLLAGISYELEWGYHKEHK